MPCGSLWMAFASLFPTFWNPFGTFWTPWASLFGPRDDSWPISGPGCKQLRKSYNLVELWLPAGFPNWDNFGNFDDFRAACFSLFFWVPIFLTIGSSGVDLGFNLWCFLGYLGPLDIGLKRWRGYDFHTLEVIFAGTISRFDLVGFFFSKFLRLLPLCGPLLGSVLGQKCEKMECGKTSEKIVEYFHAGLTGNSR